MGHRGTAGSDQVHVGGVDEVGVGEHGPPPQQTERVVREHIGTPVPIETVVVRPVRLRTVGLHQTRRCGDELPHPRQQLVAATRDEPGSSGRQYQLVLVPGMGPHVFDELGSGRDRRGRRLVAVVIGTGLLQIHSHLAHHRPLAVLEADVHKQPGRSLVHCAEIDGCSGPIVQRPVDQRSIDPLGERGIGKTCLQRERIAIEPDLERHVECLTQLRPLWRMVVQVDEPGEKHNAPTGSKQVAARLEGPPHECRTGHRPAPQPSRSARPDHRR